MMYIQIWNINMSYHKIKITKHDHDSPFKIGEEYLEFLDSIGTNNPIMAIQELSDLYGCVELQAKKLGVTMDNLKKMSDLTREVFLSGGRVNKSILEIVTEQALKIGFLDQMAVAFMPNNFVYFFNAEATMYNEDPIPNVSFLVELIKGDVRIGIHGDGRLQELTSKDPIFLMSNITNEVEYYLGQNSIFKVHYFEGYPLLDEFEQNPKALEIIKEICESKNAEK